jgi:hypothetical protein
MILVPASGREEPENEKMSDLDQEMSAIVKNPKLSSKEKVALYNEVLRRNLIFESRLLMKPLDSVESKLETRIETSPKEELIEEEKYKDLKTPFLDDKYRNVNTFLSPINGDDSNDFHYKLDPDWDLSSTKNEFIKEEVDPTLQWENYYDLPSLRAGKALNYHETTSSLLKSQEKIKRKKKLLKRSKRLKN